MWRGTGLKLKKIGLRHMRKSCTYLSLFCNNSCSYPLIGDTYVMWSERPTDWRPINHSCDPNTWLVGLDMQARRDIQKNEPITIEYATFCAVNMKPFECKCGTKLCRKIIKPDDCMQSWVEEKYMDHISDYIKIKRAEKKHEIQNHHKDHHDHKVK